MDKALYAGKAPAKVPFLFMLLFLAGNIIYWTLVISKRRMPGLHCRDTKNSGICLKNMVCFTGNAQARIFGFQYNIRRQLSANEGENMFYSVIDHEDGPTASFYAGRAGISGGPRGFCVERAQYLGLIIVALLLISNIIYVFFCSGLCAISSEVQFCFSHIGFCEESIFTPHGSGWRRCGGHIYMAGRNI